MTTSRRPPTGMASAHDVFGAGHCRCTYRGASRRSFGRHAPTARAIFFAALLSFSTAPAAGMRGTKKLTVDQGKFREWYRFCFDRGDAKIKTILKKGSVEGGAVMLCKRREYLELLQERGRTCEYFRADQNTCEKVDLGTEITKRFLNGYYIFLVGVCNDEPSSAEIDVDFSFVNHDNNHLSCELTLFPALYLGICFAWLVATTLWAAHWLVQPQHSVSIHKIMTAVPAVQVFRAAIYTVTYSQLKRVGTEHGALGGAIVIRHLMNAISRGIMFTLILTLAKGWTVLRSELTIAERRTLLFGFCWVLLATFSEGMLGGLFLFLLVFVVILVLRLIFASIAFHYHMLMEQYSLLRELRHAPRDIEACRQLLQIYSGFRHAMGIYLFAVVLLEIVQSFVPDHEDRHIHTTASEALDFGMVLVVGWLFRARAAPETAPSPPTSETQAEEDGRAAEVAEGTSSSGAHKVVVVIQPAGQDDGGGTLGGQSYYTAPQTLDEVLDRSCVGVLASSLAAEERHVAEQIVVVTIGWEGGAAAVTGMNPLEYRPEASVGEALNFVVQPLPQARLAPGDAAAHAPKSGLQISGILIT